MPLIRFGLQLPRVSDPQFSGERYFEHIVDVCAIAERSGFDSLWIGDHVMHGSGRESDPLPEAAILLGGVAARTERAQLGMLVAAVTFRNPALLAKMVTTLDVMSGGRAVLGLGAAWNADEHRRYGFAFPPLRERMELLEDAVCIARAMFTQESASYQGHHISVDGAHNYPRPLRRSIPIVIGGNGERRTLRLVAQYADACNFTVTDPDEIRRKLAVLARHCEDVGRDPATISKTRGGGLVIADCAEQAQRDAEQLRLTIGLDEERFQNWAIVGTPDRACELIQASFDAGIDGHMFVLPDSPDGEAVAMAGETLRAAFG